MSKKEEGGHKSVGKDLGVTLLSGESGMSPEVFEELKKKYGLEVRIRTNKAGLQEIMNAAGALDGYDRTHPGYDRSYDKS